MEPPRYHIVMSEDALLMLDRHVEFLARVSTAAAQRTADQLMDDIESLAEFPDRHRFYDNPFAPSNRYRQMLSERRYLILYEISDHTVYVDYILDCRQENKSF